MKMAGLCGVVEVGGVESEEEVRQECVADHSLTHWFVSSRYILRSHVVNNYWCKNVMFVFTAAHRREMESDVCSHVKVVVRVRPVNESEIRENLRNVIQVVDKHMLIFDPKEEGLSCFGLQRVRRRDINKRANKDLKFVFDQVFGENSSQDEVFENTTKGVLDSVMNGFNCTGNSLIIYM